jgi:CPA1 family monovalent cation:H+ antiporter
MVLITALLFALPGAALGFIGALVFAAIIVATDPVAVLAIFRSMAVPKELATIIEAESLLNDGTGVVVFELTLAIALGQHPTALGIAGQFAFMVAGGAAIGAIIGGVVWLISKRADDPMIEVTLTVIAAYGSFGCAEQLGASGVIASVAAGLLCGASKKQMKAPTLAAVDNFWEYVAFALNSLVFLLMGLSVSPAALLGQWLAIVLAWTAVTLSRGVLLFGIAAGIRIRRGEARWPWAAVATWAGLRGALAMTLALSLPDSLPGRELLIQLTFGVVLLTLVAQGLTIGPLVRRLGVSEGRSL